MTLVRLIARPMLAAVFVIQGIRAIKDPEPLVAKAKPVTDRLVPTAKRIAPAQIADRIPDDTRTLVRLNGVVNVLGGLSLATGKNRRMGALLLAASLVPSTAAGNAFWEEDDPGQRTEQRLHFLKNVGLTGGLLLAAVDTEGKPGLWWRTTHGAKDASRASKRAVKAARREGHDVAKAARREGRSAAKAARREAKRAASAAHVG